MQNKKFDCVEMKRKGAELVQQRVATLAREEQLEYWRKGTLALKQEIASPGASCVMENTLEYWGN
jgi:hypothetical protein